MASEIWCPVIAIGADVNRCVARSYKLSLHALCRAAASINRVG